MTSNPANKPARRQRSVVSSFLCYGDEGTNNFRVSIFKRSDLVRSYKNKWAACSGSIENSDPNPLAAARREIREETTLTSADITLLRAGKSYSIVDEELNTEWTIYPFAFLLRDEGKGRAGIVIDWEHTTYALVKPEEVEERDTVPHLSKSLERVLVGKVVAAGLRELRDDHESGARVLAGKAVEILASAIRKGDVRGMRSMKGRDSESKESLEMWWRGFKMIGWHLKVARESMGAAITVAVCRALKVVEEEVITGGTPKEVETRALKQLEIVLDERRYNNGRMAMRFRIWLSDQFKEKKSISVLMLSSSSSIKACLVAALAGDTNHRIHLKIMESRPLFEGVAFARSLLKELKHRGMNRIEVEIASDASAGILAKDVDIVLLGADRISEEGDVSNKTGSLAAVLCAKELSTNVKVVVVSEIEKVAGPGKKEDHKEEDNDVSEITKHWPSGADFEATSEQGQEIVRVRNVYFEWVPAKYIDHYICEFGIFNAEQIKNHSEQVARMGEEMFGDL
ncbi:MAG: hypothetical protein M1830_009981 [Pleopsidium flavum]|nr:MAG: hypothetical protein M1830_009981 [Pleopsidium flavum]